MNNLKRRHRRPDLRGIQPITGRQFAFLPGFLHHFQEQQVAEFIDVFLVRDAVVSQDMAQVPEFRDDVGGVHGVTTSRSRFQGL
jgi:hypothetical protein